VASTTGVGSDPTKGLTWIARSMTEAPEPQRDRTKAVLHGGIAVTLVLSLLSNLRTTVALRAPHDGRRACVPNDGPVAPFEPLLPGSSVELHYGLRSVWLPGLVQFAVQGCWDHGSPVSQDAEGRFAAVFRPTDELVCLWIDNTDQNLLKILFDLDADGFQDAIDAGRIELVEAARLSALDGGLTEVVSSTDEGYSTWSV
jgi:hypothetical protein